jgi:hypothetical protein
LEEELNALSQLAQEGNEGDLSLGRVALAAVAALSAPGAGNYFSGMSNSIGSGRFGYWLQEQLIV